MTASRRLERLARAQRALADVAAAEHVAAVRAHQDSEAEADLILAALNSSSPLHGIAVPTMAGALKRNGRRTVRLGRAAEAAGVRSRREECAADVFDRHAKAAAKVERNAAERREIEELGATWHLRR